MAIQYTLSAISPEKWTLKLGDRDLIAADVSKYLTDRSLFDFVFGH